MKVFPNLEPKKINEYHSRFTQSFQDSSAFRSFVLKNSEEQIIKRLKEVIHD